MKRTAFIAPVFLVAFWLLISCVLPVHAFAEPLPALRAVPATLPDELQTKLSKERASLEKTLSAFLADAAVFNARRAEDQSDAEYNALGARRTQYITEAKAFNRDVDEAVKAFNNDLAAAVRASIIKKINALAKRLGWSVEKQARLDMALNKLDFDGDPNVTSTQINHTWQDVITRGQDPELAREASQGSGLGFPGAGTQTVNKDCAVFALANAAGLPYGVVATRATELIRQGDWREASDRVNPQAAIEQHGLTGGEVVMLAESFGQAEVVPSSDFAKTLKAGRPVMVNVVPPGVNLNSGHEVVLTKTFQHGGETWFEMMDSYQGPQRRLFLSSKELNTILQENGVAYRPEPGMTPNLLRDGGDQ
ncbi:MAG: hypothetical protein HY937_03180 [Nitrosomonadales bacterium]|nr:hypothetical protein [Nitrosomonadales bacterium]